MIKHFNWKILGDNTASQQQRAVAGSSSISTLLSLVENGIILTEFFKMRKYHRTLNSVRSYNLLRRWKMLKNLQNRETQNKEKLFLAFWNVCEKHCCPATWIAFRIQRNKSDVMHPFTIQRKFSIWSWIASHSGPYHQHNSLPRLIEGKKMLNN